MRLFLLSSIFLLPLGFGLPASAQSQTLGPLVQYCGTPSTPEVSPRSEAVFCDVYTRQLSYRESRQEFRQRLEARQQSFAEPSRQARANYQENLKALYETIE